MATETISKLSDHAAVLTRQRDATGCVIVVLEKSGSTSIGKFFESASPADVQDALCAALYNNYEDAKNG